MDKISKAINLSGQRMSAMEEQLQRIDDGVESNLRQHGENLNRIVTREARTIERNMERALLTAWSRPIVMGLLLLLSICGGSWGLMHWLSSNIRARLEIRAELGAEIAEQRLTVQQLQETTWGVRFHEAAEGRFLVLPRGTVPATGWTVDDQLAVKLLSE